MTLPKALCDVWRLIEGSKLTFELKGAQAVMQPVTKRVDDLYGVLHQPEQKIVTQAKMDKAVRIRVGS
ncbi:MAG: AbrB family transcriptional regulator [Lentisphaerae bacterium]|nr:AbrB family transcriptional regulator [Lentisphaerota bacterium]